MHESWLKLEGKTIIVTGGASGIGFAIAQELLDDNANVVICDMNPDPTPPEAPEGRYLYILMDVTNADSVKEMITRVKDVYGGIDAIVNNAGINLPRLLVDEEDQYELTETVWDKVMAVNLKGVFVCTGRCTGDGAAGLRRYRQRFF